MRPQGKSTTIDVGNGAPITIETGVYAKQADGSVTVTCGGTVLMCTVVSAKDAREDIDFLPLQVEYREKFSSTGRFPGGFFKREARPGDHEILTSRLVDRALRPLFPGDYHADTQVQLTLMSHDRENPSDSLACLGAAAAIAVSDIPFAGPVSEVRVIRVDGKYIINPTISQMEGADIDLIVAGTESDVIMVEGEMDEVSEAEMLEGIKAAHTAIIEQCKSINALADQVEKSKVKRTYEHEVNDADFEKRIHDFAYQKCYDIAKAGSGKEERGTAFSAVKEEFKESLSEEELAEKGKLIGKYFKKAQKAAVRNVVLDEKIRLDGRQTTEIRPIWCEVDLLPGPHGSAVFTRGETQAMNLVTLGSTLDEQTVDNAITKTSERFILHYNFPPFSTGETRPIRGPGRREIGHGNLAQRALKGVIPTDTPYTIRLNCDVLESNGSSSMATVCSGTLALMDAGIKITAPVSGIAMGMISDPDGRYAILSDILGDEDHLGDMDFKVTGTEKGITATQMDMKVDGLSYDVLAEALEQARQGRLHILGEMMKTLSEPREDYKEHAPRIVTFEVPKESIGPIIGPGGRVIQEIQAETGAQVSIDEIDGVGKVEVMSENKAALDGAVDRIKAIAFPPTAEVGEEYEGKVKTIMPYGAFVEIFPGTDGLLHVSELAWERIENVEDVVKEGEMVKFKIVGKDPRSGKLKLSRKVLMEKPEGYVERPSNGDRRGGGRGRGDRNQRGGGRPERGSPRPQNN